MPRDLLHEFCLPQKALDTLKVALGDRRCTYHFEYDTRNLSLMHGETIVFTVYVLPEVRKALGCPIKLEQRYKEHYRKLKRW